VVGCFTIISSSGKETCYLYLSVVRDTWSINFVISKEYPVSGGAEFPDHGLMSVTVRVRVMITLTLTLFDEAATLFGEATIF